MLSSGRDAQGETRADRPALRIPLQQTPWCPRGRDTPDPLLVSPRHPSGVGLCRCLAQGSRTRVAAPDLYRLPVGESRVLGLCSYRPTPGLGFRHDVLLACWLTKAPSCFKHQRQECGPTVRRKEGPGRNGKSWLTAIIATIYIPWLLSEHHFGSPVSDVGGGSAVG